MEVDRETFDLRLKTPFSYILAGPTSCGKTTFCFNLLKYRKILFDKPTDNVFYFYSQYQNIFESFKSLGIVKEWINELPTRDTLNEKTLPFKDGDGSVVIIDDYMNEVNNDVSALFTVLSHANNVNVIFLTQNVFPKEKVFRTISLNSTYMNIFKNPRDPSQIAHFAKQFSPDKPKYIVEAFNIATKSQYSYLMFDFHQSTDSRIRVRSHFLPHESPIRVYKKR